MLALCNLITLTRRAEGASLHVAFRLDPNGRVFHIDVGGRGNSRARIHFGEMGSNNNPLTTMGNVGILKLRPQNQRLSMLMCQRCRIQVFKPFLKQLSVLLKLCLNIGSILIQEAKMPTKEHRSSKITNK